MTNPNPHYWRAPQSHFIVDFAVAAAIYDEEWENDSPDFERSEDYFAMSDRNHQTITTKIFLAAGGVIEIEEWCRWCGVVQGDEA